MHEHRRMFGKILCAVDFSAGSQQAFQLACRIAKDAGAELVIAHAFWVPPHAAEGVPEAMWSVIHEDAERVLAEAKQQALRSGVANATTVCSSGVPWVQIADVASDRSVDLVVIGTHGRTGVARFLLGSVAGQVVRHAECSVLVARGDATEFHHVLCPVDFSDYSHEAARLAGELARESITLFHAVELPLLIGIEPGRISEIFQVHKRATDSLAAWGRELETKTRAVVSTYASFGSPAVETLAMLEAKPTLDLVVVGSRGRTGIRRVVLGSVAEKIVRHSRTSVLVARARG